MKANDYLFIRDVGHKRRTELTIHKNKDYADSEDVLANFRRVSQTCDRLYIDVGTEEGTCLFFIIQKVDRLAKLIMNGTAPENETLRDTLDDLHVYSDLLEAILVEKGDKSKPTK